MIEIKNYAVRIYGGLVGAGDFHRATIHLFDNSNKLVGVFRFYDTGGQDGDSNKNGIINSSMNIDRLAAMVDLLRNEKPIYMGWQENPGSGYISTTQEPVGEGE